MKRYKDISEALNDYSLDKVIVLDTETTGLSSYDGDEILSISICDGNGNKLLNTLIKPKNKKKWDDAQAINGISPRMVSSSPTIDDLSNEIRNIIYRDVLVVGYNLYFDLDFITRQCNFDDWPLRTFDVMHEYARVHGEMWPEGGRKYTKLDVCAKSYGYHFNAHNSMDDALATLYCYKALLADDKYLNNRIPEIVNQLQLFRFEQRKATKQNIHDFVSAGTTKKDGLLKIGAITTGKNKGKPRYEAYIDGKCVGVTGLNDVNKIRKLYMLDDEDQLPDDMDCVISMTSSGDVSSSTARVLDSGTFSTEILRQAEDERKENGYINSNQINKKQYDKPNCPPVYQQVPPPPSTSPVTFAPSVNKINNNRGLNKPKPKKHLPIALWVILAFFCLCCTISSFQTPNDILVQLITALIFAALTFLCIRKIIGIHKDKSK